MIYSDAGIYLNETKASLVYSRLSKHIRKLGLKGFRAYCAARLLAGRCRPSARKCSRT
jgi:chemotaxis methyl-accepting protein methylase